MAETTFQHPSHDHPLELWEWTFFTRSCDLCRRDIPSEAYACHKGCKTYYHRACAEAPPRIDSHPLHPQHPLTLHHGLPPFRCSECGEFFKSTGSSFRCDECDLHLDISCALSTLSVRGSSQGEVPERITVPIHPHHPLTSFSTKHNFVLSEFCFVCKSIVDRDGGYTCLVRGCAFQIHKRCIPDMFYADGTKAPQVYHQHPLEVLVGDDTKPTRCGNCGSNESSGEFIGCANCRVFYHRDCICSPDILRYPPHHPDHSLVLFINIPSNVHRECESCSRQLGAELCYCCPSCEFFVHISCALQTLAYCEEGMSAEIKWAWHEHPLLLCHKAESGSSHCSCCGDELTGATYKCNTWGCEFLLHKRCIGIQPTMVHPYHPDQLTLCANADGGPPPCRACCGKISGINYSCKLCAFYLHAKCATRVPTRKHYLHEHELLYFDEIPSLECNRCGSSTDSPVFRCFLCNFNLHERCLELPQVVNNSTIHWHKLILHETFVEDDSGEYYCDHCEKRRDGQLGVYMCEQCKISIPRTYHIECVLPELGKVFEKGQTSDVKSLDEQIARTAEKVREDERKLEEAQRELDQLKQKLDELRKQRADLTPSKEKNSAAMTGEADSEGFVSFSV